MFWLLTARYYAVVAVVFHALLVTRARREQVANMYPVEQIVNAEEEDQKLWGEFVEHAKRKRRAGKVSFLLLPFVPPYFPFLRFAFTNCSAPRETTFAVLDSSDVFRRLPLLLRVRRCGYSGITNAAAVAELSYNYNTVQRLLTGLNISFIIYG